MPQPTKQSLSRTNGSSTDRHRSPNATITWLDRDSNPGSLVYCASTLPLSTGCCLQPEHRPTLDTICHRGGKPGLEPTELASHTIDRLHFSFPCLIRFVTKSARNHAGTGVSFRLLLAARAQTHKEPPIATGAEKERVRPGLEPRATDPHDRLVTDTK